MLNNLSANALLTILKCLEQDFDYATISKLRRSNYKIRSVADSHGYDRIKAWELRLEMTSTNFDSLPLTIQEDVTIPTKLVASYSIPNRGYTNSLMSTFNIVSEIPMNWNREDDKTHLLDESIFVKPADRWWQKPCTRISNAFDQLKSVHTLTIQRMNFDKNVIEEIMRFKNVMSSVEALQVTFCEINTTEAELTEFLQIFSNLAGLRIEGVYQQGIVTDQHLQSVRDFIHIRNGEGYLTGPVMAFPGITDDLVRQWMIEMPQTVCFEGVSTGMSFPTIMELVKKMIPKSNSEKSHSPSRHYTLGTFYSDRQFQREIALAQRVRGVKWEIKKIIDLQDRCFIWTKDQSLSVLLFIDRSAETPDFKSLLVKVRMLKNRVMSEGGSIEPYYLHILSIMESYITEEITIFCKTCRVAERIQIFEEGGQTSKTTGIALDEPMALDIPVEDVNNEVEPSQWDEVMASLNLLEANILYLAAMVPRLEAFPFTRT